MWLHPRIHGDKGCLTSPWRLESSRVRCWGTEPGLYLHCVTSGWDRISLSKSCHLWSRQPNWAVRRIQLDGALSMQSGPEWKAQNAFTVAVLYLSLSSVSCPVLSLFCSSTWPGTQHWTMFKNVHEWNTTQHQHNAIHTRYLDWFVSNFSTWSYQFSLKESPGSWEETRICRRQNWMKWIKDRCPEEITLSWQHSFLYYVFKSNFMCNLSPQ